MHSIDFHSWTQNNRALFIDFRILIYEQYCVLYQLLRLTVALHSVGRETHLTEQRCPRFKGFSFRWIACSESEPILSEQRSSLRRDELFSFEYTQWVYVLQQERSYLSVRSFLERFTVVIMLLTKDKYCSTMTHSPSNMWQCNNVCSYVQLFSCMAAAWTLTESEWHFLVKWS